MPKKKEYGKKKRLSHKQFFETGFVEWFTDGTRKTYEFLEDGTAKLMK